MEKRTAISAINPTMVEGQFTEIYMTVWFEELPHPVPFVASILDCEPHGRQLWFRAMKGEYGEIKVVDKDHKPSNVLNDARAPLQLAM